MSSDSENGALEGYCVLYRELHSGMPKMEKCVPPGILDAKITGLLPWRYYEVTVIAYNNIGRGVESRPMAARTFAQGLYQLVQMHAHAFICVLLYTHMYSLYTHTHVRFVHTHGAW